MILALLFPHWFLSLSPWALVPEPGPASHFPQCSLSALMLCTAGSLLQSMASLLFCPLSQHTLFSPNLLLSEAHGHHTTQTPWCLCSCWAPHLENLPLSSTLIFVPLSTPSQSFGAKQPWFYSWLFLVLAYALRKVISPL